MRRAILSTLVLGCSMTVLASEARAQRLKPSKPVTCIGIRSIKLVGRLIKTGGTAVTVKGACNITLINSRVEAGVGLQLLGTGNIILKNSQVIAKRVAARVTGTGNVKGEGCTLEGQEAAVQILGTGNVKLKRCTVKGKIQRTGLGSYTNDGGSTTAGGGGSGSGGEGGGGEGDSGGGSGGGSGGAQPPKGLKKSGVIRCSGTKDMVLRKRLIRTKGNAIVVEGKCDLVIDQSHIVAGGIAVLAQGAGDVRISRSWIEGQRGAVLVSGAGDVYAKGSTLKGSVRTTGNGDFHDQGGNTRRK